MRLTNIQMVTKVDKKTLLEKVKQNLENHLKIVAEAREGYLEKAADALEKALDKVSKGEVIELTFKLRPPVDYSDIYKSVIIMLEWHQNDFIELAPDEFRQLVEDRWEWGESFFGINKVYSATARMSASEKGY